MKIFIAGCARSGTTLLSGLMSCFRDTYSFTQEKSFEYFEQINMPEQHIVLKRKHKSHEILHQLPTDIELIYSVRHPFDTLTSIHPDYPDRKYYVPEKRWRAEYAGLKALRAAQPARNILYVRYVDLVATPDSVQQQIADRFGLQIALRFSETNPKIFTSSLDKYKNHPEMKHYLWSLPNEFRHELKEFCDEFGFELPQDYLSPSGADDKVAHGGVIHR